MGTATLGFAGGPAITFRIDPELIQWNWQVLTNVVETIGGRVVQVIGAYLDDLTVSGSFGQDHSTPQGVSWLQAEAFLKMVTAIMEFQSKDSNQQDLMHPPAIFTYPPKNWRFRVYVKALTDADGDASIIMTAGKFNQRYVLSLFIVQDASDALVQAGTTNGVFSQKAYDAIAAYMGRISAGVGWHFSQYNGSAAGPSDLKLLKPVGVETGPPSGLPGSGGPVNGGGPGSGGGSGGSGGGGGGGGSGGGGGGSLWAVVTSGVSEGILSIQSYSNDALPNNAIQASFKTEAAANLWFAANSQGTSYITQVEHQVPSQPTYSSVSAPSLAQAQQEAQLTGFQVYAGPLSQSFVTTFLNRSF
jgi:hypothetical protein